MSYAIFKVGIVGGGTMGGGVAALIARQGLPVIVKEGNEELAIRAHDGIFARFQGWYDKGKINKHRLEELQSLVTVTARSDDLSDVQLFIEAVREEIDLKLEIFREFDRILPKEVIMVSNTSSLPITKLAEATTRGDKVAGMHFFNPPTRMLLVELVRGRYTSEETFKIIDDFAKETLEKKTIRVEDRPGFLVNCLLLPYLNEAVLGIEEALVTPEAIDETARGHGWVMGPFTLLDFVGIDVAVFVAQFLTQSYGDRMKMGTLFSEILKLGRLGDKVGVGFYSNDDSVEPIGHILERLYPNRRNDVTAADIFERMMSSVLNEAVFALESKVASKEDIELGAKAGIFFPSSKFFHSGGPLHTIDSMGALTLLQTLERLERTVGSRFSPRPLLREKAGKGEKFFSLW
ncbi:MAG: 3-hydroxyacyl-CoA dehydrogenase NAD-binding domain-containing protein [bacterium]|nr:3-hydroxyacyl-CoA dehydrogenase NAD-binding domain-containing protein [bacterium]